MERGTHTAYVNITPKTSAPKLLGFDPNAKMMAGRPNYVRDQFPRQSHPSGGPFVSGNYTRSSN